MVPCFWWLWKNLFVTGFRNCSRSCSASAYLSSFYSLSAFADLSIYPGLVVFVIPKDFSNYSTLFHFPASEWVKGKQLEEVVTIKNTWVLHFLFVCSKSMTIVIRCCLSCFCRSNYEGAFSLMVFSAVVVITILLSRSNFHFLMPWFLSHYFWCLNCLNCCHEEKKRELLVAVMNRKADCSGTTWLSLEIKTNQSTMLDIFCY